MSCPLTSSRASTITRCSFLRSIAAQRRGDAREYSRAPPGQDRRASRRSPSGEGLASRRRASVAEASTARHREVDHAAGRAMSEFRRPAVALVAQNACSVGTSGRRRLRAARPRCARDRRCACQSRQVSNRSNWSRSHDQHQRGVPPRAGAQVAQRVDGVGRSRRVRSRACRADADAARARWRVRPCARGARRPSRGPSATAARRARSALRRAADGRGRRARAADARRGSGRSCRRAGRSPERSSTSRPVARPQEVGVQPRFRRCRARDASRTSSSRPAAATSGSTRCVRPIAGRTACRGRTRG